MPNPSTNRVLSIDILRALTMFLMIFVNDFWSLKGVPKWLLHTKTMEDGMGFSDVIFPLFLFIVGLSIPLAIGVRRKKGANNKQIVWHILGRTFALLLMGIYMVNFEYLFDQNMLIKKQWWEILMAVGIVLIWLDFKRLPQLKPLHIGIIRGLGAAILVFLAIIYQGGSAENPVWMQTYWWGILGLIGWAYLLNSLVFLLLGKRLLALLAVFLFLSFLNMQEFDIIESAPSFKFVIGASSHLLVLAGVLCTVLFQRIGKSYSEQQFLGFGFLIGALMISYGFALRPWFIISKNLATPSWTNICIGIGFLCFVLFYILVDKMGYAAWAKPIKAAGTSTLTCYLMPYFIYPIITLLGVKMAGSLPALSIGLPKSMLFSLAIILFVGFLERKRLRLKV